MEPREYVDARWSALIRAAVLLGATEADAPAIVRRVLDDNQRRIRRAADPDPLVHRALAAAIPGAAQTAFGAESDLESRREMLMSDDEVVASAPPGPRPQPRLRRRWPMVLVAVGAAAALVAAVAVTMTLSRPDPAPGDRLRADQVPSLFGYDATSAVGMLDARGLDVTLEPFRACEVKDRVVGTDPPTGTTFTPGDPITVYTSVPADVTCLTDYDDIEASWQLVDFLNGRGRAPAFTHRVIVYVADGPRTVISGADHLSRWSATGVPAAIQQATDKVALVTAHPLAYAIPSLTVGGAARSATCGGPDPPVEAPGEALSFTIGAPDARTSCPVRVDVFRQGDRIAALALYPSLS